MYRSAIGGVFKMRQSLRKSRAILFVGLPAALLACGSSTTAPSGNSAAGSYTAISFLTTGSAGQRNELQAGSTLVLNLNADGTTSGHLHIAAAGANPAFDADMAGTWTQNAFTVNISQSADTFVRNMPFSMSFGAAGGWELYGDTVFSNTRIQILLQQH
jgi:hypothetical protein